MREEDYVILREIQKNTEMGMKAIDTISEKVMDDTLSKQLTKQAVKYSELHNRATNELLDAGEESYRGSRLQNMMLTGSIEASTLFNTSNSHIAEMMIQGSNRGITDMYKVLKHNERADAMTAEFAKELMDFEEKAIERLKDFL